MTKTSLPLFDGAIQANLVGSFMKAGTKFDLIKPGYDSQGEVRRNWMQIVHEGVPIYDQKMQPTVKQTISSFEAQWEKIIGDDMELFARALASVKGERTSKFMDGESGEAPAPSVVIDGQTKKESRPR